MAILVFVLSLALLAAGAASAYASLDLLPTSIGVLYALAGAVAVSAAIVTFALAVAIRRIDALAKLLRRVDAPVAEDVAREVGTPPVEPPLEGTPVETTVDDSTAEPEAIEIEGLAAISEPDEERPINENRAGHFPTFGEAEHAIETPEAAPNLVGRYSSGGANYLIFTDGSIEAETDEGTFKFASMGDFKQYLADRRDRAQPR